LFHHDRPVQERASKHQTPTEAVYEECQKYPASVYAKGFLFRGSTDQFQARRAINIQGV